MRFLLDEIRPASSRAEAAARHVGHLDTIGDSEKGYY
jgi:hypothetical protein